MVATMCMNLCRRVQCAPGSTETSAEDQWAKLQQHPDVLAAAPDDEILAELLATQVDGQTCTSDECLHAMQW